MRVGFIGAGNIAGALINGILKSSPHQHICASDKNFAKLQSLQFNGGVGCVDIFENNSEVIENSDIIILSVKPNVYSTVLEETAGLPQLLLQNKIFVTVAPGITIGYVKSFFSNQVRIVRSMPNMNVQVGAGMTIICGEGFNGASNKDIECVQKIFECVGKTCILPEHLMDCSVAVCGSSPAYVYMLLEAMADTAVKYGLDYQTAYAMSAQSVMGAAMMALTSATHPAQLRESVCSPGGTTIEAVLELERHGFKSAINSAMTKCAEKALLMSR